MQQGAGIEDGALIDQSQERAVCVYVRRVLDERKPAFECFQTVPPSPPPPPPEDDATRSNRATRAHQTRTDLDDSGVADTPERSDVSELDKERGGASCRTWPRSSAT
eukprot:5375569-Prymnesium_polylepis.1